jgi:hypothetical protein
MVDFFFGMIVGVVGLALIALRLANKPKAASQANVPSAVGIDLSGNSDVSVDAHSAYLLRRVFKDLEKGIS